MQRPCKGQCFRSFEGCAHRLLPLLRAHKAHRLSLLCAQFRHTRPSDSRYCVPCLGSQGPATLATVCPHHTLATMVCPDMSRPALMTLATVCPHLIHQIHSAAQLGPARRGHLFKETLSPYFKETGNSNGSLGREPGPAEGDPVLGPPQGIQTVSQA